MSAPMHRANSDGRLFESIETFAARAFNDFPRDKHIAPQTGWGAEIAHVIAPLERSGEVRLPAEFPHLNSTSMEYAPISTPAIREFYANDLQYWEKVCASFNPEDIQARWPYLASEARQDAKSLREVSPAQVRDRAVD